MGRKQIPKYTIFGQITDKNNTLQLYSLEGDNFKPLAKFPYGELEIKELFRRVSDMFNGSKVQLAVKVTNYKYFYVSCNNKGLIYEVVYDGISDWECDCQYFQWFVKTGQRDKPCHHVSEVKLFNERVNRHLQNTGEQVNVSS